MERGSGRLEGGHEDTRFLDLRNHHAADLYANTCIICYEESGNTVGGVGRHAKFVLAHTEDLSDLGDPIDAVGGDGNYVEVVTPFNYLPGLTVPVDADEVGGIHVEGDDATQNENLLGFSEPSDVGEGDGLNADPPGGEHNRPGRDLIITTLP